VRGQIDILNSFTIVKKGQKINQSAAALLDKLKIRPFEYKMNVKSFLEDGKLYDSKVLSITNEQIIEKFKAKSQNLIALSLGSRFIIPAAAPHLMQHAFKNLAAASLASGYEIPQLEAMKAANQAPAIVKKSEAEDEPIDEKPTDDDLCDGELSDGAFNIFGDDEEDY
jgi:large subunit ribosomal protein LP0